LSNNGGVTSSEANTNTFTSSTLGSEESNVFGFENVDNWFKIWINLNIFRFTSEGSVVDFHFVRFEDANIARDVFTTLDLNDISSNDRFSINFAFLTISDNVSNWWNKVLELSHHFSRFGRLSI